VIRKVPPEKIGELLATICAREGIIVDMGALLLIAEATELHIRDALKAVEGISLLGPITRDSVASYLGIGFGPLYLKILAFLGMDEARVVDTTEELFKHVSPGMMYERIAEAAMLAYRVHLKVGRVPSYWNMALLEKIAGLHGHFLLQVANVLASRPGHPTLSTLQCDLVQLHYARQAASGIPILQPVMKAVAPLPVVSFSSESEIDQNSSAHVVPIVGRINQIPPERPRVEAIVASGNHGGIWVDPRAVNQNEHKPMDHSRIFPLDPTEFRQTLRRAFLELIADDRGSRSTG